MNALLRQVLALALGCALALGVRAEPLQTVPLVSVDALNLLGEMP